MGLQKQIPDHIFAWLGNLLSLTLTFLARYMRALKNIRNILNNASGGNIMQPIKLLLLFTPSIRYIHRPLHRAGNPISIQNRLTI